MGTPGSKEVLSSGSIDSDEKLKCKHVVKNLYPKIKNRLKHTGDAFEEYNYADIRDESGSPNNPRFLFFDKFMNNEELVADYLLDKRFETGYEGE